MSYLVAWVYRNAEHGDCSLGGVSAHFNRVLVPVANGPIDDKGAAKLRYPILEPIPPVFKGCPPRLVVKGEKRHGMFGGNFAFSSDSRFGQAYGHQPVAIHDRIEN